MSEANFLLNVSWDSVNIKIHALCQMGMLVKGHLLHDSLKPMLFCRVPVQLINNHLLLHRMRQSTSGRPLAHQPKCLVTPFYRGLTGVMVSYS